MTAVAYDSGGMTNAARVWFILQYYGLKAVILNGGWPVLASASGLPPAAAALSGGFRAVPGSGPVGLVDRETLRDQLDGRAHVLDTRTRAEFTGEDARNRARSGHLPGARHLSHVDLLENGAVHPAPGPTRDAGAGRVRPGRPYRDPLRRRREGRARCRVGDTRRI